MSPDAQPTLTPQAVLGVVIALVGVIFTLDNLGLANADVVLRYWPLAPIAVGVAICMHAERTRDWVFGALWMTAGAVLLARSLGWVSFRFNQLLPLLLVALGVRLVWRSPRAAPRHRPPPIPRSVPGPAAAAGDREEAWPAGQLPPPWPPAASGEPPADRVVEPAPGWAGGGGRPRPLVEESMPPRPGRGARLNVFAILAGVERRIRAERFRGADLTAILGGCELDLREARLAAGEVAHISAFALWGGIEIRVPPEWAVINESTALMGGVEDATRPPAAGGGPRLVVRGFALMGGIEIKN